ncbi:MAG TPA: hypothetical protein VEX14_11580 [Burkholderiaceae bacterium]|nr:hypothetical protein [Burkholderiaceae bacterium]
MAAGNMTATTPASATTGGSGTIALALNGLVAGVKCLGSVVYGGDPGTAGADPGAREPLNTR